MADADFKSGFVALIGRPNVGKSTLLNKLLGQKITIVTPKPQTTRTRILGILHNPEYQIVFVDTPGIHSLSAGAGHRLGEVLVQNAIRAIRDSDINILMLDATDGLTEEDIAVSEKIARKSSAPVLVAVNKIDISPNVDISTIKTRLSKVCRIDGVVPISALEGENIGILLEKIISLLPQGPPFFESDTISDQRPEEIAAEIIREKITMALYQEVPYHTAVAIDRFAPSENNPNVLHIQANIIVAKSGQKALVIGRKGRRIKAIGTLAREELEHIFGKKVFLQLWVKIRPKWFDDDVTIKSLGYKK